MNFINHENVERFFDFLDAAATCIYEATKMNYFESLMYTCDYLLFNEESLNKLDAGVIDSIEKSYENIKDYTFNQEEIRKAIQLSLLKGLKHADLPLSEVTPDSIGVLFAIIADIIFAKQKDVSIFDPTVGSGNLLFALINNSKKNYHQIYGVDDNLKYLEFANRLANLLEYECEFFHQNNLKDMLVPPVDLVISDLPGGEESPEFKTNLVTHSKNIKYQPYLMMENFLKYGKAGGYFFYLIPNDFFIQANNELMKEIILASAAIQAIIELPLDLFTDAKNQKSILILRKKGKDIPVNKEILMMRFPSFSDKEKVQNAIEQIKQWYKYRN